MLKYEIHYRKISEEIYQKRNTPEGLTKYDGRDACGGDEWSITDHEPSDGTLNKTTGRMEWAGESHTIVSEPFTYYAIFVKTMMNKDLNKDNKVRRRLSFLGKLYCVQFDPFCASQSGSRFFAVESDL